MIQRRFHTRSPLPWVLALVLLVPMGRADKITTNSGQSVRGIIVGENKLYVDIDTGGVLVPVPRERIKIISILSPENNARELIDRALEAMSRNDISMARTLTEQIRRMNSTNPVTQENIFKLDEQLSDIERNDGTKEERRSRARKLLRKAQVAYDRIRNKEGNQLLIQALKVDRFSEDGHQLIDARLASGGRADLLLAAEYFSEIMWPDNVRANSPVIELLPEIYLHMADLFEKTMAPRQAPQYAKILMIIAQAFQGHPEWMESGNLDKASRQVIQAPVEMLLADRVRANLGAGDYQIALKKLANWAYPRNSVDVALLNARAQIGVLKYDEAQQTLEIATNEFANDVALIRQFNALKIVRAGLEAEQSGNEQFAIEQYETVYAKHEELLPELDKLVGKRLAALRSAEMEKEAAMRGGWKAADIASVVMRYAEDELQCRRAADILLKQIPFVPWAPSLSVLLNGQPIPLSETARQMILGVLSRPLAVRFDETSPFNIHLTMDLRVSDEHFQVLSQAIANNPDTFVLEQPVHINGLKFHLVAGHPTLGNMVDEPWGAAGVAQPIEQRRLAEGETYEADYPVFINMQSLDSFFKFIQQDLGFYISPDVVVLPGRLRIPLLQDILTARTATVAQGRRR